jgi:hypothetical protein
LHPSQASVIADSRSRNQGGSGVGGQHDDTDPELPTPLQGVEGHHALRTEDDEPGEAVCGSAVPPFSTVTSDSVTDHQVTGLYVDAGAEAVDDADSGVL